MKKYNCIKEWYADKVRDTFKKLPLKEQKELLPELYNIHKECKVILVGQQQMNIIEDEKEV